MRDAAMRRLFWTSVLLAAASLCGSTGHADSEFHPAKRQTVYVPVYSNVFHGDHDRPFHLNATLSIRSTDLEDPMTIESVDYYDTDGGRVRSYLDEPRVLAPLAAEPFQARLTRLRCSVSVW